jgi:ABC-type sugar transport system ATPase subunit
MLRYALIIDKTVNKLPYLKEVALMEHSEEMIFVVNNISKSFGGVRALREINLKIRYGKVHAIVGENGAGKSTLMNIIGGVIQPDGGEIYFKGEKIRFSNPMDSIKAGIALIHQELSMMPSLNIVENIFMGRMKSNLGFVKQTEMIKRTQEVLDLVGLNIDPFTIVKNLSISQRQLVEIAKALSMNASLIMMDEPNSSLTELETERLFKVIEDLKEKRIAIIYVSHKMSEVLKISDEISVLRDGEYIGTVSTNETTADQVIKMMVGRQLEYHSLAKKYSKGASLLEVKNLTGPGFNNISFTLGKGEILGFAGLVGSGRSEIARALFGAAPFDEGSILIEGKAVHFKSPATAIKHGLAMVQEDRKKLSLFMGLPINFNMSLIKLKELNHWGIINKTKIATILNDYISKLNIKLGSLSDPVSSLSGGNQQKTVLARWLAINPKILILDEPTHGVDVGAKLEIYKLMRSLTENGISIILISSELPEIILMSDRVVVMREGNIKAILDQDQLTEENIMTYAVFNHSESA